MKYLPPEIWFMIFKRTHSPLDIFHLGSTCKILSYMMKGYWKYCFQKIKKKKNKYISKENITFAKIYLLLQGNIQEIQTMYGPLSTLNHMRSCIVRAMELKPYLSLFSEDPRPGLDFGLWLNMMRYHKYILEQGSHLPMLIPKTNLQIKFKKLNYEWKRISIELSLSPPHLNLGKNLIPYMQKNLILNLHIGHNEQYRFRIFKTKNHYFVYFKYKIYKNSNLISLELQEPYKRWRRLNNSLFGLFDQEYTFWPMDGFNLSAFKAHEFINLCKCKYTKKSVQKMAKHSKKCQFCGSGLYSKVTLKKGKCISCLDKLV